jgi:hypothetical protein
MVQPSLGYVHKDLSFYAPLFIFFKISCCTNYIISLVIVMVILTNVTPSSTTRDLTLSYNSKIDSSQKLAHCKSTLTLLTYYMLDDLLRSYNSYLFTLSGLGLFTLQPPACDWSSIQPFLSSTLLFLAMLFLISQCTYFLSFLAHAPTILQNHYTFPQNSLLQQEPLIFFLTLS